MLERRTVLRAAAIAIGCVMGGWGMAAAEPAGGKLVRHEAFASAHADPRNVTVWLPPGYEGGTGRYAVLYMHDGQNIFEPGSSYGGEEWGVDEAMLKLMAEGKVKDTIVVGVWNTPKRWLEYYPAGAYARLPDDLKQEVIARTGSAPLSDGYLKFLVEELKPFIDKTYRTLPEREHTSIMGSSMGGLISLYAAAEYPEVFGAAGCVSTHWPIIVGSGGPAEDERQATTFPAAMLAYVQEKVKPSGTRIYFDFGTETLDALYEPHQLRVDAHMEAAGFRRGVDWETRKFEGAAHNEASWRERVHIPLTFLLGK